MTAHTLEASFVFDPEFLRTPRKPGLSGFMRIRNGEDWLRESVLSHLDYMDEVVGVYNACTDRTQEILAELLAEHPDKMRVVEYKPRVHPVGSDMHMKTPAESVHSIANYYNFALSQTRYSVATKLDDDHVAIRPVWESMRGELEASEFRLGESIWCFSGVNLVDAGGALQAHGSVPFAGNGDHWLFEVGPKRYFTKDKRFERFNRRGLSMRYMGIAYWHMKFLKKDCGFSNYELEDNPNSRYHKQKARYEAGREGISLEELAGLCRQRVAGRGLLDRFKASLSAKQRLAQLREETFDLDLLKRDLEFLGERIA